MPTSKEYRDALEKLVKGGQGPYEVEVDDHSDDCGTVYKLKGPNVGILSKDEEELKARAEDFNLGFEMGRRDCQRQAMTEVEALAEARKRWPKDLHQLKISETGNSKLWYQVFIGVGSMSKDYLMGQGDSWEAAFAQADKEGK